MKNNFARETYSNYLKGNKKSHSSSYNELAGQYAGIVNQPTSADSVADAFTHAGNQPAVGPAQRESGALLSGIGAGIKGSADDERKSKLKRLEEQTAQLLELDGQIKKQGLEEEGQRQKVSQFFKQNTVPIASLSQASLAGDTGAANQLAQGILRNYKQAFQDPSVGDFDHFHNGVIYYENPETGTIEGRNLINLMYQSGIEPIELFGQDAAIVEAGLSPGAKREYEDTEKLMQGKLQEQGLRNQKLSSDISYRGAQMQDLQHRRDNPGIDPEEYKANARTAEFNRNLIRDEIKPQMKANEGLLGAYDAIGEIAENNSNKVGSNFKAKAWRSLATALGSDPDIDYAALKSVEFEKMLKPILGGQLGEKEGERVLKKFVSLDQNPKAIQRFLTEEKPRVIEEIVRGQKQINAYNQQSHANLYDNAINQNLEVDAQVFSKERAAKKAKLQGNSGEQQGVMVQDPDTGEQQKIPANMLEEAKRRGLVVVQ